MKGVLGFIIGGAGGLMLGIIIGVAILGGFGYWQSGGTNIPYHEGHNRIGNAFEVWDITYKAKLNVHHLQTGPIEFSPTAPFSSYFPAHLKTTQSVWTFTSGDDIDVILVILGPGTDNKTYSLNFQRLACNQITLSGMGQSINWPAGDTPARTELEVKLP